MRSPLSHLNTPVAAVLAVALGMPAVRAFALPYAFVASRASGGTLRVVDLDGDAGAPALLPDPIAIGRTKNQQNPGYVAMNPLGTIAYVVTGNDATDLSVVDVASRTVLVEIPLGSDLHAVAVDPTGSRVYVAGRTALHVVDAFTLTTLVTIALDGGPNPPAATPPRRLAVSGVDPALVYVTDPANDRVQQVDTVRQAIVTVGVGDEPRGVAVAVQADTWNAEKVYTIEKQSFSSFAGPTVEAAATYGLPTGNGTGTETIAVTPDGGTLIVGNRIPQRLHLYALPLGASPVPVRSIDVPGDPGSIAQPPGGGIAYLLLASVGAGDPNFFWFQPATSTAVTPAFRVPQLFASGSFVSDVRRVLAVTSPSDARDATPGDGVCAGAAGVCSLRAAIEEANASPGAEIVVVPAGSYALSEGVEDGGASAAIAVDTDLSVVGDGAGTTLVSQKLGGRLLDVAPARRVQLTDLALTAGSADDGGAVRTGAGGALTLLSTRLDDNEASGFGGAVAVSGHLAVHGSRFARNVALDGGALSGGTGSALLLSSSTIDGNVAGGTGGGIRTTEATRLLLRNVTIHGNDAPAAGGGIEFRHSRYFDANDVTVTGNTGATGLALRGTLWFLAARLANSVVADNAGGDCFTGFGHEVASTYSLVRTPGTCTLTGPRTGDLPTGTDPMLGPLQDNGGETPTRLPAAGSPLVAAANPVLPGTAGNPPACEPLDQRGLPRDQGRCDVGAVEAPAASGTTTTTSTTTTSTTTSTTSSTTTSTTTSTTSSTTTSSSTSTTSTSTSTSTTTTSSPPPTSTTSTSTSTTSTTTKSTSTTTSTTSSTTSTTSAPTTSTTARPSTTTPTATTTTITTTTTSTTTSSTSTSTTTTTPTTGTPSTSTTVLLPTPTTTIPTCGDGVIQAPEECDYADPAVDPACCSSRCRFERVGTPCGDDGEAVCDEPDSCDGQGRCRANLRREGTPCRTPGTRGACDGGGTCDGVGPECPLGDPKAGCDVAVADTVAAKRFEVDCFADATTVEGGRSTCTAEGFEAVPVVGRAAGDAAAFTAGRRLTKPIPRGKQRLEPSGTRRRRVVRLRLNGPGRKLLRLQGTVRVLLVVRIEHVGDRVERRRVVTVGR